MVPTYDYECEKCGKTFEFFQKMTDKPLTKCPKCQARKLRRLIGAGSGIIFKGSGFYETDYKRKEKKPQTATEPKTGSNIKEDKTKTESDSAKSSKTDKK